jgi:phosphatidylglycerol:prolipoprotein diacylglycerol transferase
MSYPYLSDIIKSLTGYKIPIPFATFGLFVVLAMFIAGYCLKLELSRLYYADRTGAARRRVKGNDGAVCDVEVPPHEVVTDLSLVVTIAGVFGARLFHIFEHIDIFLANPWSMILNRSGLSIFGGLIFGTIAGVICIKHWRLPVRPLLDAVAPAMMLGYAIGRIGCQVSGDGDWGVMANMTKKPSWLPTWAWAQAYENNIFGVIIPLPGVYPTPMYETLIAVACFGILWALRKHPFHTGWLFSIYLILAGSERFLIEKIRINPVFKIGALHATQAEFISVFLVLTGIAGVLMFGRRLAQKHADTGIKKATVDI